MSHFTPKQSPRASPLPIVTQIPLFCATDIRVLDMGVGTGRNTLFLARLGFRVDAIDCSRQSINEIHEYAKASALPVCATVHDLRDTDPRFRRYGLVLCTFALHYLTPERAHLLLANARSEAEAGTLHVIGAITVDGEFSREFSPGERFYPDADELYRTYIAQGWIIHRAYVEKLFMLQTHPDGSPMVNSVSFLIAQKPVSRDRLARPSL